ncbi:MAG: hypothetical protein E5W87_20035 [Mesorhizobium sp.]|nr:MAG: hypothetical protein E5W87_20035 [Mesorhizobium sp.]
MRRRFDLTDFERSLIEPLPPQRAEAFARVDDRRVIKTRYGKRADNFLAAIKLFATGLKGYESTA